MFGVHVNVAEDVDGALRFRETFTVFVMPPPVMVIAAVLFPILAEAVLTLAVTVPLLDPEAGLMLSHPALSLTVQAPFEVTVTDWF